MQTLTCPIPSNMSLLQSNGFRFSIMKLPEIEFFCQEVTLPELSLPPVGFETPLVNAPMPGEKLSFGDLSVTFLIDETMGNYLAVHDWLVGLGFPESHEQYRNFMSNRLDSISNNDLIAGYSDGVLQVLNSSNTTSRSIRFVDLFPTGLSQVQLQSTTTDTTYLAANATFGYTYYTFN